MNATKWTPGSREWHSEREQTMKQRIETVLYRLENCLGYREGGDVWVGPAIGEIRDALAGIQRINGHIVNQPEEIRCNQCGHSVHVHFDRSGCSHCACIALKL